MSGVGGGVGAPTAMSKLLAQARLSSFNPAIAQVYTAPASHQVRGDFGVKRPLPTVGKQPGTLRYLDIQRLDTPDRQTPWEERERDVLALRRWSEAGARLNIPNPARDPIYGSPSSMQASEVPAGGLGPMPRSSYDRASQVSIDHEGRPAGRRQLREAFGPASNSYMDSIATDADYHAMPEDVFERYLDKLRAERPHLKRHIVQRALLRARSTYARRWEEYRQKQEHANQRAKETGATPVEVPPRLESEAEIALPALTEALESVDMWAEARSVQNDKLLIEHWLRARNEMRATRPSDRSLPGASARAITKPGLRPVYKPLHVHAGLQYAQPDRIFTQLLAEPLPGRALNPTLSEAKRKANRNYNRDDGFAVATGGRVSFVSNTLSYGLRSLDWQRNETRRGTGVFRVTDAVRLPSLPGAGSPTGRSSDVEAEPQLGYINAQVRESSEADAVREAKGWPGSRRWIGEVDARPKRAQSPPPRSSLSGVLNSKQEGEGGAEPRGSQLYTQREKARAAGGSMQKKAARSVQRRNSAAAGAGTAPNADNQPAAARDAASSRRKDRLFSRIQNLTDASSASELFDADNKGYK